MRHSFKALLGILFLASVFCSSCKEVSQQDSNAVLLVQEYYEALNKGDLIKAKSLLADSIVKTEGVEKIAYTKKDFSHFLEWDMSFEPKYELASVTYGAHGVVNCNVRKTCKRIAFLNEAPTAYEERWTIKEGKLAIFEIHNYLSFNETLWVKNVTALTTFINTNHPEMKDFIYDQTKQGAQDYLKAMDLYKKATH